jgi:parvulin-like peptidyl-prolyl isomerase
LRADIVAGKAKFEDVAKKESDDVESGKQGGELGAFGHGQMVPEFEAAAFSAKPGDVTQPVKTQFGYHIIKVEEHTLTPFDQVKPALEKNLKQQKLRATLDALKENAKPTYDQAYFAVPPAPKPEAAKETPKPETKKQ